MIQTRFVPLLLGASSIYSFVAVVAHARVFAFSIFEWSQVLLCCLAVVAPFGLLYASNHLARTPWARSIVAIATVAASLASVILYAASFQQETHASMYVLIYFALPVVQGLVAALVLATCAWLNQSCQ